MNTDNKHTQGEWMQATDHSRKVGNYPNTLIFSNGKLIANCSPNVLLPKEEREANAKLIAAAPELLKVAEMAKQYYEDVFNNAGGNGYLDIGMIEAAITKYKGL